MLSTNVMEKFSNTIAQVSGQEKALLERMAHRLASLSNTPLVGDDAVLRYELSPFETEDSPAITNAIETEDIAGVPPGAGGDMGPALNVIESD